MQAVLDKPMAKERRAKRPFESESFGMWRDRADMANPEAFVRQMRKGRFL
jgi:hypothetical protein